MENLFLPNLQMVGLECGAFRWPNFGNHPDCWGCPLAKRVFMQTRPLLDDIMSQAPAALRALQRSIQALADKSPTVDLLNARARIRDLLTEVGDAQSLGHHKAGELLSVLAMAKSEVAIAASFVGMTADIREALTSAVGVLDAIGINTRRSAGDIQIQIANTRFV